MDTSYLIEKSGARLVWLGSGCPKQEETLRTIEESLGTSRVLRWERHSL